MRERESSRKVEKREKRASSRFSRRDSDVGLGAARVSRLLLTCEKNCNVLTKDGRGGGSSRYGRRRARHRGGIGLPTRTSRKKAREEENELSCR